MSGQSFLYGTIVLLTASIFNKIIGFSYQVMLMRLIKPEGVGLFSMIFPIYIMVLVLATMGIPVAISKLIAEETAKNNLAGAYRIFKVCLAVLSVSGLVLTVLLLIGSPLLIKYIFPNPDVYFCFISLIPGIFIVSICSAFRGFFQGLQRMTPTALTQAVEQLVRVSAGLSIAWILLPKGVAYAAVGISLGVVCGELAGLLFMIYIYITRRPHFQATSTFLEPLACTLRRIFNLGIPITLTRFVSTALMSMDALIIPRRLQSAGMSLGDATATYGQFVGIAETLLFTPGVITIALATAMIPAVSDALAQKKVTLVRCRIEDALRITILMGSLVAAVFLVMPYELSKVLFGYESAGEALLILALSGPFLYLMQTTTGIFQGLGRAEIPFKNLLKSSILKILGIYYLTSIPGFGIRGTAISLGVTYIVMSLLNYWDLKKITGLKLNNSLCIYKPVIASATSALFMLQSKYLLSSFNPGFLTLFPSILVGVVIYFSVLYLIGGINASDIQKIRSIFHNKQ